MYIEFDKLTAKNFMSIGNAPIEWDIKSTKKVLIQGKNKSGKTTLFQALTFALFGRAYASKIKKANLINDINGKMCEVELYFNIGLDKYKVVRKLKPDDFKIYKNDVLVIEPTRKEDYQNILESIIKMDFKTFSQLVMLASAGYTPFLEFKLPERRAFTENFLDISFISEMNKLIKKDADVINKRVNELNASVGSHQKYVKVLQDFIDNFVQSDIITKVDDISKEIKTLYTSYKELEDNLSTIEAKFTTINYDKARHNELYSKINEYKSDIKHKQNQQNSIRKSIEFFDDNPICPQCTQSVDVTHKQKHIDTYQNDLYNLSEEISKINLNITQCEVEIKLLDTEKEKYDKMADYIKTTKSKLSWMKSELTTKYNKKTELEKEEKPKDLRIDKQKELDEITSIISKEEIELNECLEEKKYFDKILVALTDSGAKSEIIRNYVPIICEHVNKTLEKLNMYLKFELDGEFNETLKSRHRSEFQYESFSLGERMRLNISLLWAWREVAKTRTGITTNLLAFDEILEILDIDGFEELLSLIEAEQNLNCVIISHKGGIETLFDKVITVNKVKGFTQITVD